MGLGVMVGMLADLAGGDPEGLEYYRQVFATANAVLRENGLPPHEEPESLPPLEGRCAVMSYPYSFLHYLRRAYAHRVEDPDWTAEPLGDDEDPTQDPVLETVSMRFTSHLLCHSDAEGLYLPVDFEPVLFDDRLPGGMLGSSSRLRDELRLVAPALGIALHGEHLPDSEADAINAQSEKEEGIWQYCSALPVLPTARCAFLRPCAVDCLGA